MNFLGRLAIIFVSDQPFDSEGFLAKIFPNFWDFLVQFIAFIILVVLVIVFGFKPIKKFIDKRNNYVASNLEASVKAKSEAEHEAREAVALVEDSKKKASSIIDEAKIEAEREREKILNIAKEDAKKEKLKASEEIALAKQNAKEDIQKEIVDIALKASSQLLEREVNEKDNQKLVKDFVKNIEEEK